MRKETSSPSIEWPQNNIKEANTPKQTPIINHANFSYIISLSIDEASYLIDPSDVQLLSVLLAQVYCLYHPA